MSNTLSPDQVRHVARLARIELTEVEIELYGHQLAEVIDYNAALLGQVDVTGVEPTSQTTGLTNVWRQDDVRPSLNQADALSGADKTEAGQFAVKKVLGAS